MSVPCPDCERKNAILTAIAEALGPGRYTFVELPAEVASVVEQRQTANAAFDAAVKQLMEALGAVQERNAQLEGLRASVAKVLEGFQRAIELGYPETLVLPLKLMISDFRKPFGRPPG